MFEGLVDSKSHSNLLLYRLAETFVPPLSASLLDEERWLNFLWERLKNLLSQAGLVDLAVDCRIFQSESPRDFLFVVEDEKLVLNVPFSDRLNYFQIRTKIPSTNVGFLSFFVLVLRSAIRELNMKFNEELDKLDLVGLPDHILCKIKKAACSNLPCLILGETGVGKDIVAEKIHNLSGRRGPFIAVNCSAIPHNLFENELFGHAPHSFSGASREGLKGKIELANGGTFFLDEVGEMTLFSQAKLLKVLDRGEIWRLGAVKPNKIDVKIIAATNRPLKDFVSKGRFRKDLYYRLKGIEIYIPPLRERKNQIKPLVELFLREFTGGRVYIVPEGLKLIEEYPWPGNVRELKYFIQYLCEEVKEGPVQVKEISAVLGPSRFKKFSSYEEARREFDRCYITEVLENNSWNVTKTAQDLGMSRRWLQIKMKELGLRNIDQGERN